MSETMRAFLGRYARPYVRGVLVIGAVAFVAGCLINYRYARLHPEVDPYGPAARTVR